MPPDLEVIFWGAVLRMLQSLVEASPTILVGLFVAGIFRRILGANKTLRLFGGNSWRSLPQAWFLGMLLPVCSFGVFPVLRELRRAGLTGGTILAFALAAPLFNPLSFLYGLTLSEPWVIISFSLASLLIVTFVGLAWDRCFPGTAEPPAADLPPVEYGLKRLLAVLVVAAREACGASMLFILVGMFGVALLAVAFPFGSMQELMKYTDPLAPLEMLAIAVPAYDPPMRAMMQLGQMFDHGNSVGAALVLLVFGAGANFGTFAWAGWYFGVKRMLGWLFLSVAVVLLCAYAVNPFFPPAHIEDHTHGFDDFVAPFPDSTRDPAGQIWPRILDRFDHNPHEIVGCVGLAALMLLGLGLRLLDRAWNVDRWLERGGQNSNEPAPLWNRALPAWLLAIVALGGLVALSIIGCYLYYPDPKTVFADITVARSYVCSALLSGREEPLLMKEARRWDDLTRRLEVGIFLRAFKLNDEIHQLAEEFRELLEETRDAVRLKQPLDRAEAQMKLYRGSEALRRKVKELHPELYAD